MRMLLDESVPQKLRLLLEGDHTVVTTWYQRWSGMKNGELLAAADQAGFQLFITADQEIGYQQNLRGRKIAVLVLSTNNWGFIQASIASIVASIRAIAPGSYTEIEIPEVTRPDS